MELESISANGRAKSSGWSSRMAFDSRSAAAISLPSSEDASCSTNASRSPGLNGFGRAASAAASAAALAASSCFRLNSAHSDSPNSRAATVIGIATVRPDSLIFTS